VTDAGADLAARAVTVVEAADASFFAAVKDQRKLLTVLRALTD
jgi:hypothetical protein